MTDAEYQARMELLVTSLATVNAMLRAVDDADLDIMQATCDHAAAVERKILAWARSTRALAHEITGVDTAAEAG